MSIKNRISSIIAAHPKVVLAFAGIAISVVASAAVGLVSPEQVLAPGVQYFINGINDTAYYIKVIDGHINKILKNISVPGILDPGNPDYNPLMAINPNTNRLYVDDNSGLNIMDTSTNKIIGSIKEINGSNSIDVNLNTNKGSVNSCVYKKLHPLVKYLCLLCHDFCYRYFLPLANSSSYFLLVFKSRIVNCLPL